MKAINYNKFWEVDNVITYCRDCHIKNDRQIGFKRGDYIG